MYKVQIIDLSPCFLIEFKKFFINQDPPLVFLLIFSLSLRSFFTN